MATALMVASAAFAALSLVFFGLTGWALKNRRAFRTASGTLLALLTLSLSALAGTLSVSTQGYRALTHEELAASVTTRKLSDQRFEAHVVFSDGRDTVFVLAGDEFYVDAHILKWKPLANLIGFHTDYSLDRISGRYVALEDEQSEPRTVFSLSRPRSLDLFELRRRYPILGWLVDAEYGSGTFIGAEDEAAYDVLVSTSGLLVRERETEADRPG